MQLQDYDLSIQYQATLQSSDRITSPESKEEVRELVFDVEHPEFDWQVGQNIGVLAPGRAEMGQEYHFRLYTIANLPPTNAAGHQQCTICVRRCSYIDEYSGEEYPGVASNYLCDLKPGDSVTLTGPYGQAFEVPHEKNANLVLIGGGTGIAPFRAFVRHLYERCPDFEGRVMLFHGAHTGLELLYRNDQRDDFALYYDQETFEAINALSDRPGWNEAADWDGTLRSKGAQLAELLNDPKTYVYIAGLNSILDELNTVFADITGTGLGWTERKMELEAEGRWVELLYG